MPDTRTTLDDLRDDADAAYSLWLAETDPDRRRDLRNEYYAAAQAVLLQQRRLRQPLPDSYRSVTEVD